MFTEELEFLRQGKFFLKININTKIKVYTYFNKRYMNSKISVCPADLPLLPQIRPCMFGFWQQRIYARNNICNKWSSVCTLTVEYKPCMCLSFTFGHIWGWRGLIVLGLQFMASQQPGPSHIQVQLSQPTEMQNNKGDSPIFF